MKAPPDNREDRWIQWIQRYRGPIDERCRELFDESEGRLTTSLSPRQAFRVSTEPRTTPSNAPVNRDQWLHWDLLPKVRLDSGDVVPVDFALEVDAAAAALDAMYDRLLGEFPDENSAA